MGHQQASFPVALSGFAHRLVQRPDLLVQPVQQAQQIRPPMRIPARQRQRLDLAPPPRRPHSGTQQPFVLGHRVQLFFTRVRIRTRRQRCNSSCRSCSFSIPGCQTAGNRSSTSKTQNVSGIALVGLLLAWTAGADRACIPQQKLMSQFLHQAAEPTKVPRCLRTNPHLPAGQRPVNRSASSVWFKRRSSYSPVSWSIKAIC